MPDVSGRILYQAVYERAGDLFVLLEPTAVWTDGQNAFLETLYESTQRFLKASSAVYTGVIITTYPAQRGQLVYRAWLAGREIGLLSGPWLEWYLTLGFAPQ